MQLPNLTASIGAPGKRAWPHVSTVTRRWGFGLAVAWYAVNTFAPLGLPNFAVAFVLGLLVMLSVEPDFRLPGRGVVATGRNLVLVLVAAAAFAPVAAGMDLLRGTIPIESGHALLSTSAAICVALARFAQTRELPRPPVLGHRELIISVTALVAFVRAYHAGELFLAVLVFAVLAPVVMAVRRVRLGAYAPRRLARGKWALQAGNMWLFLALLGMTVGLTSLLFLWRIFTPDAHGLIAAALWTGLAAIAVLAAFPRRRISVATNVLVALGLDLSGRSAGRCLSPARGHCRDRRSVQRGVAGRLRWQGRAGQQPLDARRAASRDRLRPVRRREDLSRRSEPARELPHIRRSAACRRRRPGHRCRRLSSRPAGRGAYLARDDREPRDPRHRRRPLRAVRAPQAGKPPRSPGDHVQRGQVIGQVGDSGNSDEPHLHIQVQDKPTFNVEDRAIRTYPILFEGATIADPGRGDTVGPG